MVRLADDALSQMMSGLVSSWNLHSTNLAYFTWNWSGMIIKYTKLGYKVLLPKLSKSNYNITKNNYTWEELYTIYNSLFKQKLVVLTY